MAWVGAYKMEEENNIPIIESCIAAILEKIIGLNPWSY